MTYGETKAGHPRAGEYDLELLIYRACALASRRPRNGHLTIFKFSYNWRVALDTPNDGETRAFIDQAVEGKTLREALLRFCEFYRLKGG